MNRNLPNDEKPVALSSLYSVIIKLVTQLEEELNCQVDVQENTSPESKKYTINILNKLVSLITQLNKLDSEKILGEDKITLQQPMINTQDQEIINRFAKKYRTIID